MKYQLELDIDLPKQRIIDRFLDPSSISQWQPSLVSFEHLSGKAREIGAKTKQLHRMGRREVEMVETITKPNPPFEYSATYEATKVWNLIENQFVAVDAKKTKWILSSEFKCGGMMRVLSFLFPGMFKKQTFDYMKKFKDFVEQGH